MNKPNIKKANINDAIIVSKIITESFKRQTELLRISEIEYPNYVAFETKEMAISRITVTDVKILFVNDEPIGTIGSRLDGEIGIIERLAIHPSYRGNDYGGLLLEYTENQLFNNKCKEINISLVTSYQNLRKFYNEHGYLHKNSTTLPNIPFEVHLLSKIKEELNCS